MLRSSAGVNSSSGVESGRKKNRQTFARSTVTFIRGPRKRGSKEIPGVTLDGSGNIAAYDIEVQTRAVFDNVRTVLEDSGAHWEDIVDVTVFLTDMKRDFATFNRLYAEAFTTNRPTRTTVEVGALPTPIAVELKVIAWVGK